jgi:hypothetical protein
MLRHGYIRSPIRWREVKKVYLFNSLIKRLLDLIIFRVGSTESGSFGTNITIQILLSTTHMVANITPVFPVLS